jgi:hypothetical protein
VVVLFPCLLVVGSAFFFLMLDRLELQAWLLNWLVVFACCSSMPYRWC